MTNPCKIEARKSNAKNMENDANMAPKLMYYSHQKYMKKLYNKNNTKNDAVKNHSPGWVLGPGVPEEVRSSSGDSRSRFPLASNILQKTNTWQTIKKQPRTSNSHLTRTWRAGRHGADLLIYWAQGSPALRGHAGRATGVRVPRFMALAGFSFFQHSGSQFSCIRRKNHDFEANNWFFIF